jgi:signal transduction histidine kinase
MSLRLRFLLSLLAVLALMAVPALYAANRVTALRDIVLELRGQSAQSALAVGRLESALMRVDRYQRVYVVTADADVAERMNAAVAAALAETAALRDAGYGDVVDRTDLRLNELRRVTAHVEALVEQGQLEAATTYLLSDAAPLVERLREAVPVLAAAIDMHTSARVPVAQRSAVTAGTVTTAAVLLALAVAGMLALAAARVLTLPLDRLRYAMARVAEGTFETPANLPYDRDDEVGELSRSFRTMTLRLAELDRLKAEFVGTVSHDLKTPISVITGYAEMMQEELTGPRHARHRELLRSLSEQTHTLQRRVEQLLEISRAESGRLGLGLEEINVRHFAKELHRAFGPAARSRDIRFELSVHDSAPPFLIADPDILRNDVLGNLLGNAIRFTPDGGEVRLAIRGDGERLSIEVADTGRGIPDDQLEHIFDKYYRGRGANGAGLGLAIARAGVEAHRGRIEVHSRVGRGTRFRITLPVRATTNALPLPRVALA